MTPLEPMPSDGAPPSPLRRRRARSLLPFVGQEERDRALDDLAERAFPRLDFFLLTLLAAFLIGVSQVFSSTVLLIAGLACAPVLNPLAGAALGLVTGSWRFAARNLAALMLAWILAFAAAWTAAFTFSLFGGPALAVQPDAAAALAVVAAAALLTWRFLRGAADAWMPNLVVSYGCLAPLCAAAVSAAAGSGADALAAGLAWGIYSSLALLASTGAYLAFAFRPAERDARAYAGMAAAVLLGAALLLAWARWEPPAARPSGTPGPILLPSETSTLSSLPSLTLSATVSPTPTRSPIPSTTFTPTPTPVPAVVRGTGGQGVYLRDAPGLDGKKIASLQEGDVVEILGPAMEKDGTWWVPVRTASGETGWMAVEYCATVTPAASKAP
ncbi:MAG: SH3 domain-containing protein [Anaerolineales bacterium]|nr:SH3 domain-containing protein [Anaerolineales bacterium]